MSRGIVVRRSRNHNHSRMLGFGARSEGVRRTHLGSVLAIGYLAVFGVAECLMLYDLVFHTAQSEFSGLWIIVVGLPWSLMLTPVWSAVGYVDWTNRFAGTPLVYGLLASVPVLPGVVLNAGIVYWIGRALGRAAGPRAE